MKRFLIERIHRARDGEGTFVDHLLFIAHTIFISLRKKVLDISSPQISRAIISTRKGIAHISYKDLVLYTQNLISRLGGEYDLIIAIPRSGILVADIIATSLGKPIVILGGDNRIFQSKSLSVSENINSILLVDDSVSTGASMAEAFSQAQKLYPRATIHTCALFVTEESKGKVSLWGEIIPHPRVFSWNIFHAKKARTIGFDLDGVITLDPPKGMSQESLEYREWVKNAKPYHIPPYEIDVIVSNRPESVRTETEKWLSDHGVRYRVLLLRKEPGIKTEHKVRALLIHKPELFIESAEGEAYTISKETRIPVYCVATDSLL